MLHLVKAGWTDAAANRVMEFHLDWLTALRESDQQAFERTETRLTNLGKLIKRQGVDRVFPILVEHPEWAGLLAQLDEPAPLAKVLAENEGELLMGVFVAHLAPENMRRLAAIESQDWKRIGKALKRGITGTEVVFLVAYERRDSRRWDDDEIEYLQWLRNTMDWGLDRPDPEVGDFEGVFLFLLAEGEELRGRFLERDFRSTIRDRWRTLVNLVHLLREQEQNRHANPVPDDELPGWTDLVGLPGLWDFLDRPDAERLFKRRGVLAVDLLSGPHAYEPAVRDYVAELLLTGDQRVAMLLLDYRRDPQLQVFLDKKVPHRLLSDVAADLATQGDPTQRLGELKGILLKGGIEKLREAVKPESPGRAEFIPLYSVYRVYQKYSNGDEISNSDVLWAAVDVATTLAPGAGMGVKLAKGGVKKAEKEILREVGVQAEKAALKRFAANAAAGAGKVAVNRVGVWTTFRSNFRSGCEEIRRLLGALPKGGEVKKVVDITGPVRFAYQHSKIGRDMFKRMTKLEARLFMRGDARVMLQFRWRLDGKVIAAWALQSLASWCGAYAEENDPEFAAVAKKFNKLPPPDKWDDREAWKHAIGALFLAELGEVLK